MKELSLHVLDLIENSLSAKATTIDLEIRESLLENIYAFTIADNGMGMAADFLARVADPYTTTRTTRKVGLGLALVKMNAENAGGGMEIQSTVGVGTRLSFWFRHNHWNRQPLGDMAGTLALLVAQNEDIRFRYTHITDGGQYTFDSFRVKADIDDMPLSQYRLLKYLRAMIDEKLSAIGVTQ